MLRKRIFEYLAVAAFTLLCAIAIMDLWRVDLRVPFEFHGDGLLHATMVKTIVDSGWVTPNRDLGLPGMLDLRDFPAYDNLNAALIRLLAFFIHDPLLLLNLFFLLTFPLTAVIAYAVARKLELSRSAAFITATLFALAPYHFRRGVGHLFLASYYLVPVAILFAIIIARGVWPELSRWRAAGVIAFLLALSSNGGYYPFFSCFLFLVAGVIATLRHRSWRSALPALTCIAITVTGLVVNALPVIIHEHRSGDLDAHYRAPIEGDTFGLKPAQLVLPSTDHRISHLARLKAVYNTSPLVHENDIATLGFVASIGFVLLLWRIVFRRPGHEALDDTLATFNISLLLLGTIGGIGALFSLLIWAQIRSYNRVSIFIMFIALVAVGRIFDRKLASHRAGFAAAIIITLIGAAEQTTREFAHFSKPSFVEPTRQFMTVVERTLPARSAIYQLPYHRFPESGRQNELVDYEHFRPYLLSKGLRWSYGAVKESRGDQFQHWISTLPVDQQISTVATAGFAALWIDRSGYADRGAEIERIAKETLSLTPDVSADGRYALFPLADHRWFLRQQMSAEEWPRAVDAAQHPLLIHWRGGFTGTESDGKEVWSWSSQRGLLALENDRKTPIEAVIDFDIDVGQPAPSHLKLRGLITSDLAWNGSRIHVAKRVTITPGLHEIEIVSDAERTPASGDTRVLVFRLVNLTIRENGPHGQLRKAL
jgi:phosphoglycerol transferase